MNAMRRPFRTFALALFVVWAALATGGTMYARVLGLPAALAVSVIAAFLWEASFYLATGFPAVREAFENRWSPATLAAGLVVSTLLPYCAFALPTGFFSWKALLLVAGLASLASLWFLLLPRNGFTDAAFLALMAAVALSGVFADIYPSPAPRVTVQVLGQLMWTRTGIWSVLSFRRAEGVGFGFLPAPREWLVGMRYYLYFLPVGFPLALWSGLLRFEPREMVWWQALGTTVGTFFGMLWVVALAEEFFFRGLLQQWLGRWLRSSTVGLLLGSAIFGLVHLPFRDFPNWRFALIAAVAGFFYGRAFTVSGGIRAAMVAHALVNTTTRMLFSSP